ncbi:MAG: hypothetical protein EOP84_21495 [Verrucomicrobiaceae bacterium]|nr:MAG: hypothetical protein EOP84_21495 [Verrucomicrobiaceae bacterium]
MPDLKRYFEVSGHDLRAKAWPEGAERAGDISTRLGVTIGLCVANKILSFTRADWEKIGKTQAANGKEESRLDYNLAATPVGFVAVENKGSITEDNSKKCPSVSKHKSGIIKKKEDNRKKGGIGVLVGTIAVADSTDASKLQCWLLDPPDIFPDDISPNDFRMARRLRFQGRLTQLIFPSSPTLHRVIEQRARQIATEGSRPFEGEGLRYPSGKLIELKWGEKRKPYVRTEGGLWVGRLTRLREGRLLFAGLNQKWIDLVLDQDLELLANFQGKSASRRSLLKWDATSDEVRMLAGFEFLRGNIKDGRFPVSVPIELHETSGGFAFAVVERKKIKFRKKK